jgi:hypothetical protein
MFAVKLQLAERRGALSAADLDSLLRLVNTHLESASFRQFYCDLCLRYADSNGDGQVSESEYVSWMTNDTAMGQWRAEVEERLQPVMADLSLALQERVQRIFANVL